MIAAAALLAAVLVGAPPAAAPVLAQTSVSANDIQRLQDTVYDLGGEVARVRDRDAQLAGRLQDQLDDLREEVIYLKVKLRRERTVPRSEYVDLRNRLDDLRTQARGGSTAGSTTYRDRDRDRTSSTQPSATTEREPRRTSGSSVIPAGQEIDVRLIDSLSSDENQVEDRFLATTVVDLEVDGRVVIPAGSEMRGVVSSVNPAGRIDRKGSMTVSFDQLTIGGREYPLRGTVTQALESEGVRGEAARIGTGAGVGAIIGGILGGFKGALAGILIGGGGVIAATEGKDVELPAGTILRVRLDSPPEVRSAGR
jgi:hypothetical protein